MVYGKSFYFICHQFLPEFLMFVLDCYNVDSIILCSIASSVPSMCVASATATMQLNEHCCLFLKVNIDKCHPDLTGIM